MYQHGCVGGAVGLAAAKELATSFRRTAVLAVELCSLGFHREDLRTDQLVGSALFADGAACAIINRDSGQLKILDARTVLVPETEHLMGYNIHENGAHLRLDKDLPAVVVNCARESLPRFLEDNGLGVSDIATWLFHPGGMKILNLLESAFEISSAQTRASWEVLNKYGNMSSASVLFVLDEYLRDASAKPGDRALMVGIGPGLTVQYLLFSRVIPSGS